MKTASRAGRLIAVVMMLSALFIGGLTVQAAGGKILATAKTGTKKAKITWSKVADADRYLVYYAKCGNKFKKSKKVENTQNSYVFKNLSKKKAYKVKVVAQKKQNGKYEDVGASYSIHFVTKNNKYFTNPEKIKIKNKKPMSLTEGDLQVLQTAVKKVKKTKDLLEEGHDLKVRYYSTNSSVAAVNSLGMVMAKKEGTCRIYATAINGLSDYIDITVKAAPKKEESKKEEPKKEEPKKQDTKKQDTKKEEPKKETPKKEDPKYTLTYKYIGDVPAKAPAVPAAKQYKAGSTLKAATVPSVDGYTFTGWIGEEVKMPKHDVTVTGVWRAEKYTLSYSLSGDVPDEVEVPQPKSLKCGEEINAWKVSVPEGYTFSGWRKVPATMPAEDVLLTGKFSRKTYTLTIKYTGPSKKSVPADYKDGETVEYKFGEKVTLPKPSKDGYKFCGWDNKSLKTMPAKNVTVTGTWKKTYTLTYQLFDEGDFNDYSYWFETHGRLVETRKQIFVEGEKQGLYSFGDFDYVRQLRSDYQYQGPDYELRLHGWFMLPYQYYTVINYQMEREIDEVYVKLYKAKADYLTEAGYPVDFDSDKALMDPQYASDIMEKLTQAETDFRSNPETTNAQIDEFDSIAPSFASEFDKIYEKYNSIDPEEGYILTEDLTVFGFSMYYHENWQ